MAFTEKHSIYAIQFDKASDVMLGGITRSKLMLDPTIRSDPTNGEPYARHQAVVQRSPMASFTTLDLHTALTEISALGAYVISSGTIVAVNLYCVPHAAGGVRQSGSINRQYNIVRAFIVPRRLRCDFGQDAMLDVDIVVMHDGTANDPVIMSDTVALPAATVTDANRFTLGKTTLASFLLEQVRSLEIDFGLNCVFERADSDIYPVYVSIQDIQPKLTLRGADIKWLSKTLTPAKVPFGGIAGTHANSIIYLRKRAQTAASYIADNVAEHIKLTMAGFVHVTQAFDGPGDGSAETVLTMDGKYDGTNNPIVVTLSSTVV